MNNSDEVVPADPNRINVNDGLEVTYWCKEFGCSEAQLMDAVRHAGVRVIAVHSWIKKARGEVPRRGIAKTRNEH
ncbi:MAG: DUF3606 domain-containing protein [Sphingomonadales bacterium]|nr:DUF3606 domain-containing protein [Sphingomonadales bacterium]